MNEVFWEFLLGYFIMWDKYNLCEMILGGKFNMIKLLVVKLRDNCVVFDFVVDVVIKCK